MKTPQPTPYLDDFLNYYYRAACLEAMNHQGAKRESCGDNLQDNVTIYDTVHRRYAGFSNVIRDMHAGKSKLALDKCLFLYGIHRMTGSGASFFPSSEGDRRHGYCNVILPSLYDLPTIAAMVEVIRNWDKPMFTSFGNQPPPFPKPEAPYEQGGKFFFCEVWPQFVKLVSDELRSDKKFGVAEFTDWMLALNVENGFKRFKFTYTAMVMDLADWHPEYVDPLSQCYYGANCLTALNACYSDDNKTKGAGFYHAAMADVVSRCSEVIGEDPAPMDVEDCLCDVVRYWHHFVPRHGYAHLSADEVSTSSEISENTWKDFVSRV